jgi:hypothetical protein
MSLNLLVGMAVRAVTMTTGALSAMLCSETGHVAVLEKKSDAVENRRCQGCAQSSYDDGSAKRLVVLKPRHVAVPEMLGWVGWLQF